MRALSLSFRPSITMSMRTSNVGAVIGWVFGRLKCGRCRFNYFFSYSRMSLEHLLFLSISLLTISPLPPPPSLSLSFSLSLSLSLSLSVFLFFHLFMITTFLLLSSFLKTNVVSIFSWHPLSSLLLSSNSSKEGGGGGFVISQTSTQTIQHRGFAPMKVFCLLCRHHIDYLSVQPPEENLRQDPLEAILVIFGR